MDEIKCNLLTYKEVLNLRRLPANNRRLVAFVFMRGMEDEKDGIMTGFGLTDYPSFGVYLHLDESLLDEIVSSKYNLKVSDNSSQNFPFFGKGNEYLN